MRHKPRRAFLGLFSPIFISLPALAAPDSVYTDLAPEKCLTVSVSGLGSEQRCPGVAGHALRVFDEDGRQSVTVLTPDSRSHPLEYGRVITPSFSSLGRKAEWRGQREGGKFVPQALIIRVIASEDPQDPERRTAYLAVARLAPEGICVIARIGSGAGMNEAARRAAETAAGKPCL